MKRVLLISFIKVNTLNSELKEECMKEFEYVSHWSEFQIRAFRVLMRRPCLSQYYTHFHVVCGHFIYVLRRCFRGQYCRWKRGCVACRNFTQPWPHYSENQSCNQSINE